MKLILFILFTALINVTCPDTPQPCELVNGQFTFRFWKITLHERESEVAYAEWDGIKIGEHEGSLKFFNNQEIDVIYENSVPIKLRAPLLHNSVHIQYKSVNFNYCKTEKCVLEFTSQHSEFMNIKVHLSFTDSKCSNALKNALNGFSADPYGFHYVYSSTDWKKSTEYNDVSSLEKRELILTKFSIQNFIEKHLPKDSLAFDVLFFEKKNLAMV
jgi:hypothetical protein